MVGRLASYCEGNFLGAMFNFQGVYHFGSTPPSQDASHLNDVFFKTSLLKNVIFVLMVTGILGGKVDPQHHFKIPETSHTHGNQWKMGVSPL